MSILLMALSFGRNMLSALWAFFTTKPGVYVLAGLLAVGVVLFAHHHGFNQGVSQTKAAQLLAQREAENKALAEGMARQFQLDKGLIAAADLAGFKRGQAQARTITLTKEVVRYVDAKTDRDFPVPCGLVRMHDAAALGADPETLGNPSGLADDTACPVKASDLAGIIVFNYGLDHEKDAQIVGLQDLARTLKSALEDGGQVVRQFGKIQMTVGIDVHSIWSIAAPRASPGAGNLFMPGRIAPRAAAPRGQRACRSGDGWPGRAAG